MGNRFPYLPIQVIVSGHVYDVDALLDTGFDGSLVLPLEFIEPGLEPNYEQTWMLAGGSLVRAPAYYVQIQIGMFDPVTVAAVGLGSEVLIGLGIIRQFSVLLDHGQRVVVSP